MLIIFNIGILIIKYFYSFFFQEAEEIKKNKAAIIQEKEKDKEKEKHYYYKSKITVGARALSKHSDRSKDVSLIFFNFIILNFILLSLFGGM